MVRALRELTPVAGMLDRRCGDHMCLDHNYQLRFEQLPSTSPIGPLIEQCHQLREGLHNRERGSVDVFEDICEQYSGSIEPAMTCKNGSEVGTFLVKYTEQVECLLNIIRACRQGDWEEYLAALDKQIKYVFAHDLYHYARLMPDALGADELAADSESRDVEGSQR